MEKRPVLNGSFSSMDVANDKNQEHPNGVKKQKMDYSPQLLPTTHHFFSQTDTLTYIYYVIKTK
jgi:hypothetical protein